MSVRVDTGNIGHVQVTHAAAISPTTWTIDGNFRFDALPADANGYGLIVKGTYGGDIVYVLRLYNDGGVYKIQAGIRSAGVDSLVSLTHTPTLGQWYRIAASLPTGGTCNIYAVPREIPGTSQPTAFTLTASGSIVTAVPTSTENLYIGAATGGSGAIGGMSGSFCDIAVYNAVITQSVLEGRLPERMVGTEANLVGLWYCDEQTTSSGGTTVYDRANGTGRNGTWQNSPRWADDPMDLWYDTADTTAMSILGWPSWTRSYRATITASDENATYPASNLRSPRQAIYTRTANATGAKTWTFDFGRPVPIQALSIMNHNLSSGAVITIALHSADSWGAPSVSETVTYHPSEIKKLLARRYNYRYARLSITDANATGGYIQLGTCDLWAVWESTVPAAMDDESTLNDPSGSVRTVHGDLVARDLTPSRDLKVNFYGMRKGEAFELMRLLEDCGAGAAVLFCPDTRRQLPASIYGYLTGLPEWSMAGPSATHWTVSGLEITRDRP